MPSIPTWFQARDYFGNKLAAMPYADAPDGAQQLMDAFNEAGYTIAGLGAAELVSSADQLYRHFNEYGNAENISPNNYFNVEAYIQNKLAQLATTTQQPPYPFTSWNAESLGAAMKEAGLSYWDHYAKYGTAEGISPSAQFDTNEYLEAKAAQLNGLPEGQQQPLPDGTYGEWNASLVAEALANAGLSALEHYYDYGIAEKVDYSPLPEPQPDIYYKEVNLADVENPVVGTPDNENFIGTVGGRDATFTQDTSIDGGNGSNKLTLDMNGNFNGFRNDGGLANIDEVALVSTGKGARTFNAAGVTGVETWSLDESNGALSLNNLEETGGTVNITGLAGKGTTNINFARDVAGGSSDAMTIGLDNVGSPAKGSALASAANVKMAGIEDVTLNATGDNYVSLSGVSNAVDYTVNGDGNLTVTDVATTVENVDAGKATGNLKLDLSAAVDFQNATLGSGNDTLTITNLEEDSEIDGGKGADSLTISGVGGRYQPIMTSVETLTLDQLSSQAVPKLTIAGGEISGLENLVVQGLDANEEILFAEYATGELNVNAKGNNAGNLELADIDQVNLKIGGNKGQEEFQGTVILDDTSSLNLTVGDTTERGDLFAGNIVGTDLENLAIVTNRNNLESNSQPTVVLGAASNMANVSDISVTGFGGVDLRGYSALGSKAENLTVDASGLNAKFQAAFTGSADSDTISITGSALQNNEILVNGSNYSLISVTGGLGIDTLTLTGNGQNVTLEGSLGTDDIVYLAAGATNWDTAKIQQALGVTASQIVQLSPNQAPGNVVNGGSYLAPEDSTISVTANPAGTVTDLSGLTYENGNGTTDVTVGSGANVILPSSGDVKATASNLSNSAGASTLTMSASPNAGESQTVQVDQVGKDYSGQSTFTFTNDGQGEVILATGVTDTNKAGKNVTEFNQTTINLDVTNKDGSIVAFGQNLNDTSEGGAINSNQMPNVSEINLNGAGDINFSAQMGKGTNDSVTVNAGSMTGDISGLALYSKVITATLGSGNDTIQVTPYATGSDIKAGFGEDHINVSWAYAGNGVKNVIKVDLGDDTDNDILGVYSAFEATNIANAGSALIEVKNFKAGDTITAGSTGTTRLNHFVETTSDVWAAAIAKYTGDTVTTVTGFADGSTSSGLVFANGNAYLMAQGGGNSTGWGAALTVPDFSSTVKANVAIIELLGVTSGDFAAITGQMVAGS